MKNTYHTVSHWLGKDLHMLIFKRGKKQCLCPVSTISVSGKMPRACPLSWVKAKKAFKKIWLRFTKGKLCLINLNSCCNERSGHTGKRTGYNTPWVSCGSWHHSLKQTHVSKPRPDGWLEWLKTVWADRTEDLMASSCFTCWLGTARVPWGCYLGWYRSINLSVTWMMRQKVSLFMVWWLELDDLWGPLQTILWSGNLWMILH